MGKKMRQKSREKEGVSKFKVLSLEISSSAYKVPTNLCYSARDPMGKCTVSFVLSKVLQVKMLLYIYLYIYNLGNEENFIRRHVCCCVVGCWEGWALLFSLRFSLKLRQNL